MPFPYRGIDSDNGSEFINAHLFRFCKQNRIAFTRSRPYRKNDNCHVEQKNWHIVRRNIGYARFEGDNVVRAMNAYYDVLRLYTNFFLPQTKLIAKNRDGSKIHKKYDYPKTPYRRVMESEHIDAGTKNRLAEQFGSLNPAKLVREMEVLSKELERFSLPYNHAQTVCVN
jgi:hypothetical protein